MNHPKPILAIVGPTASGKTEWSLKLAKEQNAELISVDSRQIYQHLKVGTAKPEGAWAKGDYLVRDVPYHLVDIWDPAKPFSVADFVRLATDRIKGLRARGKEPILVGGTGLYFSALYKGLATLPTGNAQIRQRLQQEAETKGRAHLHERLAKVDPISAKKIPANNIQRRIRALEVYELTGKPISAWHKDHVAPSGMTFTFMGIDMPREKLIQRIEARCRAMMKEGMIEETKALLSQGYSKKSPALTGLGYPRIIKYLEGSLTKADCLALLIQDTRQYAKRQMTWFRHQLPVTWNA